MPPMRSHSALTAGRTVSHGNGSRLEGDMDVKDRQQNGRKNAPMCELLV
jgi:hypothetical protein